MPVPEERIMRPNAVGFLSLALAACSHAPPPAPGPVEVGNPPAYRVHSLSGASLSAKTATVNGIGMDTTNVESIEASVRSMLDSAAQAPRSVEEVSGQAADVSVDFTAPSTPVPATFFGADIQWRSKFFLSNPRWRALVAHTKLDILRFPGGQERVRYDRHLPSGTPASDTLEVGPTQPYEFRITGEDVAAFVRLCTELGIEAEPEVNLANDDPAMWKGMVEQIVGELKYDLRWVSVGNEPDIKSPNGNWPFYGVGGGNSDANREAALDAYRTRYLAYHAAISQAKPGLTFVYGELGMWTPDQLGKNLDRLLQGLGGNRPGAIAGHWYMLGNWGQSSASDDYPSIANLAAERNGIRDIAYLEDIAASMRARAAANGQEGAKLFLGEFGPSWSATPADAEVSNRLAAALFAAEALERGKLAGFDSMQWFGLSDPDSFGNWVPSLIEVADSGGQPRPRPQWFVYFLYEHLYGDQLVRVGNGLHADWSIHAAKDANRSYLMLVNRSGTERFEKVAQVTTAGGTRQLRLTLHPHSVTIVSF
jgi:hypothetical protein